MQLGHVAQCDGQTLGDLLARGVAGMGPSTGRRRAGRDHEAEQPEEPVVEADEWPGYQEVRGSGRVVAGRAVHQHDRVDQQEHGGEEVHHDHVGIQLRVHDDPPEDGLGQDADHQAAAEPREVTPAGGAEDRAEEGGGDGNGEDDGDQAVAELDEPVELEGRREVSGRALRPVATAEP